ncbi:MAG TPA: hypothetical protein VJ986_04215 [Gaiellaceae bacterium]|nr:hypothetical protein [Gaiellaceae bacterium]
MVSFLRTAPGLALGSLAFAACGVIVVASYVPRHPPLAAPSVLIALAALFCAAAAVRSARDGLTGSVARPALAAAVVAVGFLELVFTYDGTRGAPLVLLTIALVLVALDLPLLLGSSVASYGSGGAGSQA